MTVKEYVDEIMEAFVAYGWSPSVHYVVDRAIELRKTEIESGNRQRVRKELLKEACLEDPTKEDESNGFNDINIYH